MVNFLHLIWHCFLESRVWVPQTTGCYASAHVQVFISISIIKMASFAVTDGHRVTAICVHYVVPIVLKSSGRSKYCGGFCWSYSARAFYVVREVCLGAWGNDKKKQKWSCHCHEIRLLVLFSNNGDCARMRRLLGDVYVIWNDSWSLVYHSTPLYLCMRKEYWDATLHLCPSVFVAEFDF